MTESQPPDEQRGWLHEDADLSQRRGTGLGGSNAPPQSEPGHDPSATVPLSTNHAFPWPPPEDVSIPGAFVRTWQGATFEPTRFFRAMPAGSTARSALLYYLPLGILIAGADLFWETVVQPVTDQDTVLSSLTGAEQTVAPLTWFLMQPLLLLLSLFISAAVTHALLKLFGGASRSVGFTTAVFAFGYSPMLFGVIPYVGVLVGFVWVITITIIGLREGHGTSTGRAAAAVLIPVVFALFMLAIVMLFATAGSLLDVPM